MAYKQGLSRALDALYTTLNDQRHERVDAARLQAIVDGSAGGERHWRVAKDSEAAARLVDRGGKPVAELERRDGAWTVTELEA